MPTEREKLQATLAELHAQLANAQALEPEMRSLLEGAMSDIRLALEKRPGQQPPPSIIDRLKQAGEQFEESHPTLAGTLGSVIDALGRMGI